MSVLALLANCVLAAESMRLDVGRGLAVVDWEAQLVPAPKDCVLALGPMLRAREEGREGSEVYAWEGLADNKQHRLEGPSSRLLWPVPKMARHVRVRALLRGERFAMTPLVLAYRTEHLNQGRIPIIYEAQTVWPAKAIWATVQPIEQQLPFLVRSDVTRNKEPLALRFDWIPHSKEDVPALVVDGGSRIIQSARPHGRPFDWTLLLNTGVSVASFFFHDAVLWLADIGDSNELKSRLLQVARLAYAACKHNDPLVQAVAQRLTSLIATGFSHCQRDGGVPTAWPPVHEDLITTGLLHDEHRNCQPFQRGAFSVLPETERADLGRRVLSDVASAPSDEVVAIASMTVGKPYFSKQRILSSPRPEGQIIKRILLVFSIFTVFFFVLFHEMIPARKRKR